MQPSPADLSEAAARPMDAVRAREERTMASRGVVGEGTQVRSLDWFETSENESERVVER